MDIEAYATGFQSFSTFCKSTAPNPYAEASAITFVSAVGLYQDRIGVDVSSVFLLKESIWLVPQVQEFLLLSTCRNGFDSSAMFGENLPN